MLLTGEVDGDCTFLVHQTGSHMAALGPRQRRD